ncbi:MAG: TPM domain-containing protein [Paludibacteraceae bacterium]|nr:TPM domain-containing protein [Paludibacteraceae bacterium]
MNPKDFFTAEQKAQIEATIGEAEKLTSGEIRLHIDRKGKGNIVRYATRIFHKLKMTKTAHRNGVLFYLSVENHKFAVIGDKGIHKQVPEGFWDNIYQTIVPYFQKEQFTEGLCWAILEAGKQLSTHFPIEANDTNELTNEISFEK